MAHPEAIIRTLLDDLRAQFHHASAQARTSRVPDAAYGYRELARFYAEWIAEVERDETAAAARCQSLAEAS